MKSRSKVSRTSIDCRYTTKKRREKGASIINPEENKIQKNGNNAEKNSEKNNIKEKNEKKMLFPDNVNIRQEEETKKKYVYRRKHIQEKENPKKEYEKSLVSFYNIGNSCFMNSFLQILIHIPSLIYSLKKIEYLFEPDSLIKYLRNVTENPTRQNL